MAGAQRRWEEEDFGLEMERLMVYDADNGNEVYWECLKSKRIAMADDRPTLPCGLSPWSLSS